MIPVELSRIVIRETSEQQYIYLTEKEGERSFPIIIGVFEAVEINRKIAGAPSHRPMTHDLIRLIFEALNVTLKRAVIDNLESGTFYAKLHIEADGKEEMRIDCRPSDAIALSVALNTPIFVEDHVMDEVAKDGDDDGEIII